MKPPKPDNVQIRVKTELRDKWKAHADELAAERGTTYTLPQYLAEAVKFFEDNRKSGRDNWDGES